MPTELTVANGAESDVLRVGSSAGPVIEELGALLARFCIRLMTVRASADIPGSFWGEPEAGIAGQDVYVREDTPVHSALHEACHIVCMSAERRAVLDKDAGGTDLEEAAVCFLQITLAGYLPAVGSERLMRDMDRWGYSFRLGSTARWYRHDADDARRWLAEHDLVDAEGTPLWRLRQ